MSAMQPFACHACHATLAMQSNTRLLWVVQSGLGGCLRVPVLAPSLCAPARAPRYMSHLEGPPVPPTSMHIPHLPRFSCPTHKHPTCHVLFSLPSHRSHLDGHRHVLPHPQACTSPPSATTCFPALTFRPPLPAGPTWTASPSSSRPATWTKSASRWVCKCFRVAKARASWTKSAPTSTPHAGAAACLNSLCVCLPAACCPAACACCL